VLELTKITKTYGRKVAVNEVSLTAPAGAITGLLGPNGSGKTTLLHCLCGVVAPDSGEVRVNGRLSQHRNARHNIGFCPDDLPMPDLLTGREYLDMVMGIRGLRVTGDHIAALLDGMRLAPAYDQLIGSYSHGMKRKIQLIASILHQPDVLVLDEPFRGLDPESSTILKELLRRYAARGAAVLVSTHDLLVAEQMCDEVAVLRDGDLVAQARVDELRSVGEMTLEESFLNLTGLADTARESAEVFFGGIDAMATAGGRRR